MQIYHTGSAGWIYGSASGNDLTLGANAGNVWLRTGASANDDAVKCVSDGAVEAYYNGSKKLETTSGGVNVTGAITVNGAALGGGGATFEATTNGAVSEGDPLLVESNGKVRKVNQLSASTGSATTVETNTGNSFPNDYGSPVVYEPVSGNTYIFYNYGNYESLYYKRASVSGTTITYGSAGSTGISNNWGNDGARVVAAGSLGASAGKIGMLAIGENGSYGELKFRCGTPNGDSITWNHSTVTASFDGTTAIDSQTGRFDLCYCANVDRWLCIYGRYHSSGGYRRTFYQLFDSNGNTKGTGTLFQYEDGSSGYIDEHQVFYDRRTEKVVFFGTTSAGSYSSYKAAFRLGTCGSTSVTWQATQTNTGNDYTYWYYDSDLTLGIDAGNMMHGDAGFRVKYHDASGKYFIANWGNSTRYIYFQELVLNSAGTAGTNTFIGYSGTTTYVGGSSSNLMTNVNHLDFTCNESGSKLYWVFKCDKSGEYNELWSGSSTLQSDGTVGSGNNKWDGGWTELWTHGTTSDDACWPSIASIGMGKVIITWTHDGPNQYDMDRYAMVRQEVASDLMDKFVGIADANYADGATATVLCAGNVSDKHSSLEPGSKYYVSATGTLTTAAATPSVFAGTAVTSTTITVKN